MKLKVTSRVKRWVLPFIHTRDSLGEKYLPSEQHKGYFPKTVGKNKTRNLWELWRILSYL